ncbi:MAG: N-acetylmuramoyl-L-alanine amidase [Gemmatimonadetes bacterium]|nr:N-acetylmuramoyl-L-alanine amidase [Gemmatimonadota bacterium]
MTSSPMTPKISDLRTRRITVPGALLTLVVAAGCGGDPEVPAVDGPLALEVRYPTAAPVAVTDSISLWGTVGTGRARLRVNGRSIRVWPNGAFSAFVPLSPDPAALELEARRGDSVIRRVIRVTRTTDSAAPPSPPVRRASGWVRLRRLPDDTLDRATQERPIYSRWTPGGDLAVPLPQGVRLPVEAEAGPFVRLGLAKGTSVWVVREDTEPVASPSAPRLRVGGARLVGVAGGGVVELVASERLVSQIEVVDRQARWTLFGAAADPAVVTASKGLLRRVTIRDLGDGRVVVAATLAETPLGWRAGWRDGRMRLEVRSPPKVAKGLAGLVVALDPGHPPLGTTGPTGLREDSVALAVAIEAANRLRQLGAKPILTRTGPGPVSLDQRLAVAEAADVQAFVSIHLNSPGDGRPPTSVDGTRVYWLEPTALPLARVLRDSVAVGLAQVPHGTIQSNLVVLRATWFPAALIEATALPMPAREALFRTPEGIAGYAAGIVGGLQAWVEGWRK